MPAWATRMIDRLATRVADRVASAAAERHRADARWSPAVKVALRQLWLEWQARADRGDPIHPRFAGFRIFSQFEEDGIILCLLAALGADARRFVDIGAGDGVYASNCANLAINLGYHGLFIETSDALVERGRRFYSEHPDTSLYPPGFVQARATPDTVNDLVRSAGFSGRVDLLSIDIDGNDYWVWEALTAIEPLVVVIEAHPELGHRSLVAPYADDPGRVRARPSHFLGASPAAMTALGTRLGYRLVAANRFGFNLFYVRDDLAGMRLPAISVDDLFDHPRAQERIIPAEALDGLPFVEP
jgi:hypothetical protein